MKVAVEGGACCREDAEMLKGKEEMESVAKLAEGAATTAAGLALNDLAARSALLRIVLRRTALGEKCELLANLVGALGDDMRQLAKECRASGIDARSSALWSLLEHQDQYEAVFERNRRVEVQQLTPMVIYQCLSRRNQLFHAGWTVIVGGSREVTGGYGEPAWESRIWLQPPTGVLREYSGIGREMARALYREMKGFSFQGVDTLGHDTPHPAERISFNDMIARFEEEGTLPLIASTEHGPSWDAFTNLSVEDPDACRALFDEKGRYRDTSTGFWASLDCERYDDAAGEWYRAYAIADATEASCIGCGCRDSSPCWLNVDGKCDTCQWVRVDHAAGRGVCSECRELESSWDAGDRVPRIAAFDEQGRMVELGTNESKNSARDDE